MYYLLVHVYYSHSDIKNCMTIFDRCLHRFVIHFFKQSQLTNLCPLVKESYVTACRIQIPFACIIPNSKKH